MIAILIVNSANLLIYLLIQVLITIDVINEKKSCVFEWYTLFCIFWVDILTLLNALCFLLLFKRIASKSTNSALR